MEIKTSGTEDNRLSINGEAVPSTGPGGSADTSTRSSGSSPKQDNQLAVSSGISTVIGREASEEVQKVIDKNPQYRTQILTTRGVPQTTPAEGTVPVQAAGFFSNLEPGKVIAWTIAGGLLLGALAYANMD